MEVSVLHDADAELQVWNDFILRETYCYVFWFIEMFWVTAVLREPSILFQ